MNDQNIHTDLNSPEHNILATSDIFIHGHKDMCHMLSAACDTGSAISASV